MQHVCVLSRKTREILIINKPLADDDGRVGDYSLLLYLSRKKKKDKKKERKREMINERKRRMESKRRRRFGRDTQ